MGSSITEEAALNLLQERTPETRIPRLGRNRLDHPVTLAVEVAVTGTAVARARNREGSLVDQADQEGLEAGTRTRAVTRGTAQPQFTEVGMSWVQDSHSANCGRHMKLRYHLCRQSLGSAIGSSTCAKT